MASSLKIITGGQTGADRGALDAAMQAGMPCGGWCPAGRLDENGRIPDNYPLSEMPRGGSVDRTVQNILDADATVIIFFGRPTGGTEQTLLHCILLGRPYQLVDAGTQSAAKAAEAIAGMVHSCNVRVLNIAGPRQSEATGAYDYASELVKSLSTANWLSGEPQDG